MKLKRTEVRILDTAVRLGYRDLKMYGVSDTSVQEEFEMSVPP